MKSCSLNQLIIKWDKQGKPCAAEIKPKADKAKGTIVQMSGSPSFKQNIINKKYFPEIDTWCFLELGFDQTYNIETQKTKCRFIQNMNV